jgi:hypothetical protein
VSTDLVATSQSEARDTLNMAWDVLRRGDDLEHARWRFFELLKNSIHPEDAKLSDRVLVQTIVNRHLRGWPFQAFDGEKV